MAEIIVLAVRVCRCSGRESLSGSGSTVPVRIPITALIRRTKIATMIPRAKVRFNYLFICFVAIISVDVDSTYTYSISHL